MSKTHIKDLVLGTDGTALMDFPNADGANTEVLTTDGAGNVTWESPWANMDLEDLQDVTTGIAGKSLLYLNHVTQIWEGLTTADLTSFVQNSTDLQDLNNVDGSPTSGEFLKWNGSNWVTDAVSSGSSTLSGLSDTTLSGALAAGDWLYYSGPTNGWINLNNTTTATVIGTQLSLNGLSNVASGSPADGDFLQYDTGTANWLQSAFTLPTADGTAGQTLITDGSGAVDWGDGLAYTATSLATGDWLYYAGSGGWINMTTTLAGATLSPAINLSTLGDVIATSSGVVTATAGQVLAWNGSTAWTPVSVPEVTLYFENFCYNQLSTSEDFYYWLPGSQTSGNHNAVGSDLSSLSTTSTWNRYRKNAHRLPAGDWDIDVELDLSITTDGNGTNHASDIAGEGTVMHVYKVAKSGTNGNVTLTSLGNTTIQQDSTDTANPASGTISLSSQTLDGDERIMVLLKGASAISGTRYAHWTYEITATKQ